MKTRTISIDTDLVRVLQSEKASSTWNEYLATLLGYSNFKEFKKTNTLQVKDDRQLEINLDEKI